MTWLPARLIFAFLLLFSILFFLRRVYILFSLVLLGQPETRLDHLRSRLKGLLLFGFGQKKVMEEPFGVNHFFLFWGFILLQAFVNLEFIIQGIFPRFSLDFIGGLLYAILTSVADTASFIVLVVVILAAFRRLFFKPDHIERSFDAFLILSLVGLLMIAYFGIHGTALRADSMAGNHLPFSRVFAILFLRHVDTATVPTLAAIFWWVHALVLLAFLNYIPYSKHLHILTALTNCFFRRPSFPVTMDRLVFKKGETFGVSKVIQFTWKDLLDFFSCTECGRCARACPATATGKVLNPKEVILEGKANLLVTGQTILAARDYDSLGRADRKSPLDDPLIGPDEKMQIRPEAIWDCTTCGACVERCPVFIEQFPKLLALRRHLVMERVEFPPELVNLFENIEQRYNPFGMAPADRGKWAEELAVPLLSKEKEAEYLLFAGCVASFNGRMRNVLASLTRIMRQAGLSFAALGREERCCGDPLRRLGNEYVFDDVAKGNLELFKSYGVKKIITLCPHCYNTLKNDYPQYGISLSVIHHTELLSSLVNTSAHRSDVLEGKHIVLHDSCYLGRYNGIYEEPRSIIAEVTGKPPGEMERSRNESFCCGAGGGRMWMHEGSGTRINLERTREALAETPDIIATCCPYCLTMFEDGLKDEKASNVKVLDVAEIAAGALQESND